ncbi:MAG: acetyl-CoA carboxylase biotin carboxylase subunit [Sandaracinaceae bacterium]
MIQKLLIANRGEIASRIMRTAARMGIETVAVYSEADADLPFVGEADEAVCIGPAPSQKSYLSVEALLSAAERTGADAIHPGFGFLAENADFARAVEAAGLTFVGPSPEAIEQMGSKQNAKRIAVEAEVPVIPGYDGADQDPAVLAAEAKKIGFPVLVKASAGGGGKGMRVVLEESELAAAIEGAAREAEKSFNDGTLLIEKYVVRPRHIEIQILGDAHGEVVHFWERECSIQRRHQKIIEEAPSPAVSRELRRAMGESAVKLAKAIGYRGAGTVEMILDPDGAFYFLEVNTRLQVEHPVTEAISDVDLVELQLRVAEGEELPMDQEMIDTVMSGWAIECRLYAEDPNADFLPQSGTVLDWHAPELEGLRIDAGVQTGSEVSIHYDPMLAKVICWGAHRGDALRRMRLALKRLSVLGLPTNRDFLLDVLAHEKFEAGELTTHFIADHMEGGTSLSDALVEEAAVAVTLAGHARRASTRVLPSVVSGYRNNRFARPSVDYRHGERDIRVVYEEYRPRAFHINESLGRVHGFDGVELTYTHRGHRRRARIVSELRDDGTRHHVQLEGRTIVLDEPPRFPVQTGASAADGAFAPMPGQIVKVLVKEGDAVETGQTLLVMEAMKMEHSIGAPHDGVVTEVRFAEGAQVNEGDVMVVVKAPDDDEA